MEGFEMKLFQKVKAKKIAKIEEIKKIVEKIRERDPLEVSEFYIREFYIELLIKRKKIPKIEEIKEIAEKISEKERNF